MKLQILGSSSAGNSYILQANDKQSLLVECGVKFRAIQKALDFNYRNVAGCLVSHQHGDHAKSIKQILAAGIKTYTGIETALALNVATHYNLHTINAGNAYIIGPYKVLPFEVNHDVPCLGFLIHHPEMGNTLFLTDSYYSDYTFGPLNNIIVECNHDEEILAQKYNGDKTWLANRIRRSHLSLDTCIELLKANDLKQINNIVLIHLSDTNADAQKFRQEVAQLSRATVHIAVPGLVIDNFQRTPF